MIRRYQQRTIYEEITKHLLPDHSGLIWEEWLVKVDRLLADEALIEIVHAALAQRHPESQSRGRHSTPSEVILRLLVLKQLKNWTYATLEREVRANLIYREFTRIGVEKVPDEKTMIRLAQALGTETIVKIHERVVELGREEKVVKGRKLRVDTTVVETNIHYPLDSQLLADGVRVITRTVRKLEQAVGQAGQQFRDRMRSVKYRLIELGKAARQQGEQAKEKREQIYRKLMATTNKVVAEAEQVVQAVVTGAKTATTKQGQALAEKLTGKVKTMSDLTRRVLAQTKARVVDQNTHYKDKLLSIFEVETEAIRKGKAAKPTEFGKIVKIQEAENQIIVAYEVYDQRPADSELLLPAVEKHKQVFGHAPALVAADAAFFSAENETKAKEAGVKQVAIPSKATKSSARKAMQKERWFRRAQRWRVGCEGRISVLKRRHGLFRSRYQGSAGMQRWVGFGVIANNLISIARAP